jgi:hypothetical protein
VNEYRSGEINPISIGSDSWIGSIKVGEEKGSADHPVSIHKRVKSDVGAFCEQDPGTNHFANTFRIVYAFNQ